MKKQNPVLNTLANMNKKEEVAMTKEQLQNEILKEQRAQLELLKEQRVQLERMKEDSSKPILVVYILLAFFLGGIGAHDFYVGKTSKGLMKLAFFWTGVPMFISVLNIFGALLNKQNFK